MQKEPTYEALEQRVKQLEENAERHKQMKDVLSERESLLTAFTNALPDISFIFDEDGKYIEVMASAEHLLITHTENLKGNNIYNTLPSETATKIHKVIQATLIKGEPQILEYKLDIPTGETWFQGRTSPMKMQIDGKKTVIWITHKITDRIQAEKKLQKTYQELETIIEERTQELIRINKALQKEITERKQSDAALKDSEAYYKMLVDNSPDLLYRTDQSGKVTFISQSSLRIAGYTVEEAIGMNMAEDIYVYPEDREAFLTTLIQNGKIQNFENKLKRPDGSIWWGSANAFVLKDNDGNFLGVEGTVRDITERKQLEQQLVYSKEQAESANTAKSEFLSNMSHELRTPMQGIIGYSNLGFKKTDQLSREKLKDYFSEIKKSGHRLLLLLNDILDLSKLESGKIDYNFKDEALLEVISIVTNEFKVPAQKKDIQITFCKSEFEDIIKIDKGKMIQVVRNLVGNAIKFSNQKSEIRIAAVKSNNNINVSIIDQGIGVPEDELNSVFDKFIQSSITKTGAGGTGLGLAICKEIINAHNGEIWAENNPEGGVTFSFSLMQAL